MQQVELALLLSGLKMENPPTQEPSTAKKFKTTIYMDEADDILLNEIFIKRLRERKKTDRSSLLCEGIRLLYEKEIKNF